MNDRVFLDTNIFVYALDGSDPRKGDIASKLITHSVRSRKGVISYQVVQEFFNVALRRFKKPLTTLEGEQFLSTVFRPLLAIHSSESLYANALRVCGTHRLSWYDSLIVSAALQADCKVLYTEDLQHGQLLQTLRVVNPFL